MKLKQNYILQQVGTEAILVPVRDAARKFRGVVQLNHTAAFLVRTLQQDTDEAGLLAALQGEYNGTEEQFRASIRKTLDALRQIDALEE